MIISFPSFISMTLHSEGICSSVFVRTRLPSTSVYFTEWLINTRLIVVDCPKLPSEKSPTLIDDGCLTFPGPLKRLWQINTRHKEGTDKSSLKGQIHLTDKKRSFSCCQLARGFGAHQFNFLLKLFSHLKFPAICIQWPPTSTAGFCY